MTATNQWLMFAAGANVSLDAMIGSELQNLRAELDEIKAKLADLANKWAASKDLPRKRKKQARRVILIDYAFLLWAQEEFSNFGMQE